jgi:predicted site-specific integrase-resolvase
MPSPLPISTLAKLCHLPTRTLARWCRAGKVPGAVLRLGNWVAPLEAVQQAIEESSRPHLRRLPSSGPKGVRNSKAKSLP